MFKRLAYETDSRKQDFQCVVPEHVFLPDVTLLTESLLHRSDPHAVMIGKQN